MLKTANYNSDQYNLKRPGIPENTYSLASFQGSSRRPDFSQAPWTSLLTPNRQFLQLSQTFPFCHKNILILNFLFLPLQDLLTIWNGKTITVNEYAADKNSLTRSLGSFNCDSSIVLMHEQNIYTIENLKIQVRNTQVKRNCR